MRFTFMICLALSILGCSQGSTQRSPTAPTPPVATPPPQPAPPAPSNRYALWGVVVTSSGVCIEGATVEVKMGLVELGKHTGLSAAMLSKIEHGQLFPTLPTLLRIAMVFSVGLAYFIAAGRDTPVVVISRHQERLRFPEKAGGKDQAYEFESLDFPAVHSTNISTTSKLR